MRNSNTKERIIQAILKQGSEKGLSNVSLSSIAKEVGVTKATLFSHFTSKGEMEKEMYGYADTLTGTEAVSLEGNAQEVLGNILRHWISHFSATPFFWYYRIISQEKYTNAEAKRRALSIDNMFQAQTFAVLETLSDTQRLDINDLDYASLAFSSTIKSFIDREILEGNEDDDWKMERFISQFCETYRKL